MCGTHRHTNYVSLIDNRTKSIRTRNKKNSKQYKKHSGGRKPCFLEQYMCVSASRISFSSAYQAWNDCMLSCSKSLQSWAVFSAISAIFANDFRNKKQTLLDFGELSHNSESQTSCRVTLTSKYRSQTELYCWGYGAWRERWKCAGLDLGTQLKTEFNKCHWIDGVVFWAWSDAA